MAKNMFENLFNLSVKKTVPQAVVFYIVFLLIGLTLCLLIIIAVCMFYCVLNMEACTAYGEEIGRRLGSIIGLISVFFYCSGLGIVILSLKRLWTNALGLILFVVSLPLSLIGGSLLGMIPIAALTTLDSKTTAHGATPASESEENSDG